MSAFYQIVIRSGPNAGTAYPLEKAELFIGRDLNNEIVINDPEMSRRHARLYLQGANYVLEDLGSTNGTAVNGQRLMGPYLLRPGEMVTFGEHVALLFETVQSDQAATVAAPVRGSAPYAAQQPPAAPPAYAPPPPAYAPPPPPRQAPPAYSGQVPLPPEEDEPKKKFPVWLIILIALLLVVCLCGVAVVAIDALNLWCSLFGWAFGPGACP